MSIEDRTHKLFGRVVEDAQFSPDDTAHHVNKQTFLLAEIAQDLKRSVELQAEMLDELRTIRHRS